MAETFYASKYSGDQLDGAIAVLGSLKTMLITRSEFENFSAKYNQSLEDFKNTANNTLKLVNQNLEAIKQTVAQTNEKISPLVIKYTEITTE